jgi:hypothetical protein
MYAFRINPLSAALLLGFAVLPTQAAESAASLPGKWTLDFRLRWEQVDDQSFARDADATTLRTRLGYWTPVRNGFGGVVEVLNTTNVLDEHFNSTANGLTTYPVIADPDHTDLHQLYVNYAPNDRSRVTLGRQRLNYDNQRFIGAVGWRQNEQTFDALDTQHRFDTGLTLRYAYLNRVQRVFGDESPAPNLADWQLDAHLLNLSHALGPGSLVGYAYFIDNQTLPLTSHRDVGLRYTAKNSWSQGLDWLATIELAQQRDYANGNDNIDADYLLLEGGVLWRGHGFKAGMEQLGGDGTYAFQTPLATLHAFNGWADRFLTTPLNGLQDRYLGWNHAFGKLTANVVWHDFQADRGAVHYGHEWDASLAYAWSPHWNTLLKLADYQAGDVGFDVQKTWLSVEYMH